MATAGDMDREEDDPVGEGDGLTLSFASWPPGTASSFYNEKKTKTELGNLFFYNFYLSLLFINHQYVKRSNDVHLVSCISNDFLNQLKF